MKYVELRYEILRSIPNITLKYPNSIKPLFYQIFTGVRILSLELGYILTPRQTFENCSAAAQRTKCGAAARRWRSLEDFERGAHCTRKLASRQTEV